MKKEKGKREKEREKKREKNFFNFFLISNFWNFCFQKNFFQIFEKFFSGVDLYLISFCIESEKTFYM